MTLATARLENALDRAAEYAIKARDTREPGRARKEKAEAKLQALIMRMFHAQRGKVIRWLESTPPAQKAIPGFDTLFDNEEEEWSIEFFRAIVGYIRDGIEIYEATSRMGLSYELVNKTAATAARRLALNMVRDVTSTTKDVIRSAIVDYVNTPGMTIGDVIKALPFDSKRAERIAATETTRAYAEANQVVAEEMQRQYPDVKVEKRWFTNQDDIVCEVCGPLNDQAVAPDDEFIPGVMNPPAHVNCRCWTQVRTRING